MKYQNIVPFQAQPEFYNIAVPVTNDGENFCSEIWGIKVFVSMIEGASQGLHKRQWKNFLTGVIHDVIHQENIFVDEIIDEPNTTWGLFIEELNRRVEPYGIKVVKENSCLSYVKGMRIFDKSRTVWDLEIIYSKHSTRSIF